MALCIPMYTLSAPWEEELKLFSLVDKLWSGFRADTFQCFVQARWLRMEAVIWAVGWVGGAGLVRASGEGIGGITRRGSRFGQFVW